MKECTLVKNRMWSHRLPFDLLKSLWTQWLCHKKELFFCDEEKVLIKIMTSHIKIACMVQGTSIGELGSVFDGLVRLIYFKKIHEFQSKANTFDKKWWRCSLTSFFFANLKLRNYSQMKKKFRLNEVLDVLTITKLYINTNNIIGSIYYVPSCVLKVLHVLMHSILKPYAIGFINIPILQVKNGCTQRG